MIRRNFPIRNDGKKRKNKRTAFGALDATQEGWLFDKSQSFTCDE